MASARMWLRAMALLPLAAGWLSACGNGSLFSESSSSASGSGGATASSSNASSQASTHSSSQASSSSAEASSSSSGTMCGNGVCEDGETADNCPDDCAEMCAHSFCEVGEPLAQSCDPCVQQVCGQDGFCCNDNWDDQCIALADQLCGAGCCGNGMCEGQNCTTCPDDCGQCVCGDMQCLGEDCTTCPADCGDCPACGHTACEVGGPLSGSDCPDPCVGPVCMQDPNCCSMPPFDGMCQQLGAMLCSGGDPCVNAVCAQSPSCCNAGWDQSCVNLATMLCQTSCNCAHAPCDTGPALSPTCDPCVAEVCNADPYCCNADWDGICQGEVATVCGITCGP